MTLLNTAQQKAVQTTEGPLLILAGAGAGKTKTLTERIKHLIQKGVLPEAILAITFTNKAAKEMRDRVLALLDDPYQDHSPFVSTFHSLGVTIIRENSELIGIPRFFNIFDRGESKKAVKEALKKNDYDPKQYEPGKVLNRISQEKGKGHTQDYFTSNFENEDFFSGVVSRVWETYETILKENKALDFDDLLLKTVLLLENNPKVKDAYQERWKYVHVDEYQDTNQIQYRLMRLLTEKYQNICAVGDIDQTIYSWRGAQIKNILHFEKDFPDGEIIVLEQNYRSTQTILAAANQIIKKNQFRKEKNLFTTNGEGDPIHVLEAHGGGHEAEIVMQKIEGLIRDGANPEEIAILYRANFQSRSFEETCRLHNINYHITGTSFFERKEVKDLLSFLKLALHGETSSDLSRVMNFPPRGIGKVTLIKVVSGQEDLLKAGAKAKVAEFRAILKDIKEKTATEKPSEILRFIAERSGMIDYYGEKQNAENEERLQNIKELATFAKKYDNKKVDDVLEELLTDTALVSDQDKASEDKVGIRLLTVHSAKGLEFDYVFIVGLEEGLFPHERMSDERNEDSEEERRLFYVAVTRARKKVFLSWAHTRVIFGSLQINTSSQFLEDIDENLLHREVPKVDRKPLLTIDF